MDEDLFQRLCHVFPASGLTDLKVGVRSSSSPSISIYFFQTTPMHPHPRNSFFGVDGGRRYEANAAVHDRVMAEQPVPCPVPLPTVEAFLSLGNCSRAMMERRGGGADFGRAQVLYTNSILLSGDLSAAKIIDLVGKRAKSVTFCTMDEQYTDRMPEERRRLVAEGMAGMSLVACHQGVMCQSVSYATAALVMHPCALPFVNCVRLVALSRKDTRAVLMLTEMVLLPFFLRSDDPAVRRLYDAELAVWDPSVRGGLTRLPAELVRTAQLMKTRFSGQYGVMRAKYVDEVFVEKICAVCGRGSNGEKLHRCGRCSKIYYCGRVCQLGDWLRHKRDDGCTSAVVPHGV
jgi:hypothetical protein